MNAATVAYEAAVEGNLTRFSDAQNQKPHVHLAALKIAAQKDNVPAVSWIMDTITVRKDEAMDVLKTARDADSKDVVEFLTTHYKIVQENF